MHFHPLIFSQFYWDTWFTQVNFSWLQTKTFRDRHLSYWSSSHFFKDETTNHLERKEKSFIQYWFLHIPHYNVYQLILSVLFSHYILLECVQYTLFFALSLCLVNIKSQVSEYQKNKKKHWFSYIQEYAEECVQSASTSCTKTHVKVLYWKSFLFSFRIFRYANNRTTRGCILY